MPLEGETDCSQVQTDFPSSANAQNVALIVDKLPKDAEAKVKD